MELVVNLQCITRNVDCLSYRAVVVFEFQCIHGGVDNFNHISIDQGQPDACKVHIKGECWQDLLSYCFECLSAIDGRVRSLKGAGVATLGLVYAVFGAVVGNSQDLFVSICSNIQRDSPGTLIVLQDRSTTN